MATTSDRASLTRRIAWARNKAVNLRRHADNLAAEDIPAMEWKRRESRKRAVDRLYAEAASFDRIADAYARRLRWARVA